MTDLYTADGNHGGAFELPMHRRRVTEQFPVRHGGYSDAISKQEAVILGARTTSPAMFIVGTRLLGKVSVCAIEPVISTTDVRLFRSPVEPS